MLKPGAQVQPSRLVNFYMGRSTDDRGRLLDDILMFNDSELEHIHDYIQWLFPLPTPSAFNLTAPTLSSDDIATFRSEEQIQKNMQRALKRMLAFYGFTLFYTSGSPSVRQSEDWVERSSRWLDPYNHNYLRITRILKSLCAAGMSASAKAFYDALRAVYEHGPAGRIPARTFKFWSEAVEHLS